MLRQIFAAIAALAPRTHTVLRLSRLCVRSYPRHSPLQPSVMCVLLGVAMSGCAVGRSVVDIMPPVSVATQGRVSVKVVDVRDRRVFEAKPSDPSTPSLQSAADITNPMITGRALARKRGGYGNALGDIVLPEGRTVAGLVRAATEKALQDKGYRVVSEGSPDYATAVPVSVDIDMFWAWFSPGFATISVECRSRVNLNGAVIAGDNMSRVDGYAVEKTAAAFETVWVTVIKRSLDDLSERMKEQIKPPS